MAWFRDRKRRRLQVVSDMQADEEQSADDQPATEVFEARRESSTREISEDEPKLPGHLDDPERYATSEPEQPGRMMRGLNYALGILDRGLDLIDDVIYYEFSEPSSRGPSMRINLIGDGKPRKKEGLGARASRIWNYEFFPAEVYDVGFIGTDGLTAETLAETVRHEVNNRPDLARRLNISSAGLYQVDTENEREKRSVLREALEAILKEYKSNPQDHTFAENAHEWAGNQGLIYVMNSHAGEALINVGSYPREVGYILANEGTDVGQEEFGERLASLDAKLTDVGTNMAETPDREDYERVAEGFRENLVPVIIDNMKRACGLREEADLTRRDKVDRGLHYAFGTPKRFAATLGAIVLFNTAVAGAYFGYQNYTSKENVPEPTAIQEPAAPSQTPALPAQTTEQDEVYQEAPQVEEPKSNIPDSIREMLGLPPRKEKR